MDRSNFLRRLFILPVAVKTIVKEEEHIPKPEDIFYDARKEHQEDVRTRQGQGRCAQIRDQARRQEGRQDLLQVTLYPETRDRKAPA